MAELSVYIAGPWAQRDAARTVAQSFRDAGFNVTSRWIDTHGQDGDAADILEKEASNDLEDILRSHGMVVLQYGKSEGKAFEQGFILAASQFTGMRNKIILVSPDGTRGNVFQYLQDVYTMVPNVECALQEAKTWPGYVQLGEISETVKEGADGSGES